MEGPPLLLILCLKWWAAMGCPGTCQGRGVPGPHGVARVELGSGSPLSGAPSELWSGESTLLGSGEVGTGVTAHCPHSLRTSGVDGRGWRPASLAPSLARLGPGAGLGAVLSCGVGGLLSSRMDLWGGAGNLGHLGAGWVPPGKRGRAGAVEGRVPSSPAPEPAREPGSWGWFCAAWWGWVG